VTQLEAQVALLTGILAGILVRSLIGGRDTSALSNQEEDSIVLALVRRLKISAEEAERLVVAEIAAIVNEKQGGGSNG
jgi:hypothetical protein